MEFAEILSKISSWSWPISVIVLGLLFRGPISRAIGRVNEIEVKGVKLKMSQIEEAVDERERLKAAIEIATAGKEINIPEVKALKEIAAGMQTYLIKPEQRFIKRLLRSAYDIAMKDGDFSDAEHKALLNIAYTYDWEKEYTESLLEKWKKGKIS